MTGLRMKICCANYCFLYTFNNFFMSVSFSPDFFKKKFFMFSVMCRILC